MILVQTYVKSLDMILLTHFCVLTHFYMTTGIKYLRTCFKLDKQYSTPIICLFLNDEILHYANDGEFV